MNKVFSKEGLSFIGVTVATAVAITGIIAILTLATTAIQASLTSEMRLVASGLAQEGIEVVRGIRQSYVEWSDWEWYSTTTPVIHPIGDSVEYCLQCNTSVLSSGIECPSGAQNPLKFDSASGFYQYGVGQDSPFYRKVILTRLSEDEIKVEARVSWKNKKGDWINLIAENRLWRWK